MIKTLTRVNIPIGPKITGVMFKYEKRFPDKISSQKLNEKIKYIGKIAKLNDPVKIKFKTGREEVIEEKPRYKVISIHTGRRSFCTNAFLNGVPVLSIMDVTGHKSEKTFLKYIKASNRDRLDQLSKTGIF
jgi:integrase